MQAAVPETLFTVFPAHIMELVTPEISHVCDHDNVVTNKEMNVMTNFLFILIPNSWAIYKVMDNLNPQRLELPIFLPDSTHIILF